MADVKITTTPIDRSDIQEVVPIGNYRMIRWFENVQDDLTQSVPDALADVVTGPDVSVVGNVAVFGDATGGNLDDSGVGISELAKLDSPAFTGTPTAPTPGAGDSSSRIATTAYVSNELSDFVEGPGSAVNNRIAVFDGTSGKIIKDGGALISSLAPLASPVFTGNPTAPTALLGDNDTSIATTAFVQAQVASLNATYFSAHAGGVSQSIPNATFTKLVFGTEVYDVGAKFATSTWTPPARLVHLVAGVSVQTIDGSTTAIAIYKNGSEYRRGVTSLNGNLGSAELIVSCMDVANGTDTYEAWIFQSSGASQNTDAAANFTYFQGTTIRP